MRELFHKQLYGVSRSSVGLEVENQHLQSVYSRDGSAFQLEVSFGFTFFGSRMRTDNKQLRLLRHALGPAFSRIGFSHLYGFFQAILDVVV